MATPKINNVLLRCDWNHRRSWAGLCVWLYTRFRGGMPALKITVERDTQLLWSLKLWTVGVNGKQDFQRQRDSVSGQTLQRQRATVFHSVSHYHSRSDVKICYSGWWELATIRQRANNKRACNLFVYRLLYTRVLFRTILTIPFHRDSIWGPQGVTQFPEATQMTTRIYEPSPDSKFSAIHRFVVRI